MLRFSWGGTGIDRNTSEGHCMLDVLERKSESRLRRFGHEQRKDNEKIGRRMMRLELPERRSRGRVKRRFIDVVKEDMKLVG